MTKKLANLASAQLIVDKEKSRQQKLAARRATRELVKALRVMAEMLEGGEIAEWSIDTNFGYNTLSMQSYFDVPDKALPNGRDDLKITFHHSLTAFTKRLRCRKRKN